MDFRNTPLCAGRLQPLAVASAIMMAGCGDVFEITNPGRILDEDLDTPAAMTTLVTGMSADLSTALDDLIYVTARASDEMAGSGNFTITGLLRVGTIDAEFIDGEWGAAQRARWVAESGLERMTEVLGDDFDGNPLTARAYLLAGLSNRLLGENFCQVTFDGGAAMASSAAFERAVDQFTTAIDHAQQAGEQEILTAAYGGRAQVLAALGEWDAAAADAALVPTDFVYEALYAENEPSAYNTVWEFTHQAQEFGAFNTLAASFDPPDPRAPYTDCSVGDCERPLGDDGSTIHYRQDKYPERGSDIPVVKGTEMRLIEAEAKLMAGQLSPAMTAINEVRSHFDLPERSTTAIGSLGGDDEDAWTVLDEERHLTLWLEARRLWDLRRWQHPFLNGGTIVYPGIENRDDCLPIGVSECQTNPNIECG